MMQFFISAIAAKEKCVRDYSVKCFDTFSRQVTNNLITSSVKTNKHYCISPKHRQTFIRLATCANSRKDHQDQIMKAFISTVHAINSIEQKNLKLPLLCWYCHLVQFKMYMFIIDNHLQQFQTIQDSNIGHHNQRSGAKVLGKRHRRDRTYD